MRKLASIRIIDEIRPIDGADAIECAVLGGWTVVVKKGEFAVGYHAVYLEIDSWVPTELAPFLSKGKEPREFNGVKGERLRTIKLRGQLSQGLLLPLSVLPPGYMFRDSNDAIEVLGIQKWEAPISPQLAGQVRGNFPSAVPKTDQERIQNLTKELEVWRSPNFTWEVTEKLEGSSCTFFLNMDDEFEVCSRNLSLKRDENNAFWRAAISNDVENKIRSVNMNIAIQGEIVGPNIQGNIYKLNDVKFFVFDIYDAQKGTYLSPNERRDLCAKMNLEHVPVINTDFVITQDMQGILDMADGASIIYEKTLREGIVFKCNEFGGPSFKAISNQYLLKS